MTAVFELYTDAKGEFRWRLRHQNGNILADSGESYTSKQNALDGIKSTRKGMLFAAVEDKTTP